MAIRDAKDVPKEFGNFWTMERIKASQGREDS